MRPKALRLVVTGIALFCCYWVLYEAQKMVDIGENKKEIEVHTRDNGPIQSITAPGATKVILLAYFRGGSSFLGDVFNRNPDAFYWFEPLAHILNSYELYKEHKIDEDIYVADSNFTHIPDDLSQREVAALVDIMNCNLKRLDSGVLLHGFTRHTRAAAPYHQCLISKSNSNSSEQENLNECLPLLEESCKQAKVRVAKVLRIGMYMVPDLLEQDPDIKVVHYTRDPRGALRSRYSSNIPLSKALRVSSILCHRIQEDIDHLERSVYKGAVTRLRYEDLARYPLKTVTGLYSSLSIDLPGEVRQFIEQSTHALQNNGGMGTARTNSTETAFKWKELLSEETISAITSQCRDILERLNYETS